MDGALERRAVESTPSNGDPVDAVLLVWDFRGLIPSGTVLIDIGIERHGQKASGRVQVHILSECASGTPSAWLTTFNATRSVLHATFGASEASVLLLRYSSRLGSSDAVKRRAERVEVRHFIECAASTPSAWLPTLDSDKPVSS
jgi:hypothetical protein